MGFWDLFPFGHFDLNRDGKISLTEKFINYKICEDTMKGLFDDDSDDEPDWHLYCEDGLEFDIYPEDYETEEEYEEALWDAKYGWRDTCEDGSAFDVDPEDYETEEEYEDALWDAKYGWRDTCEDGSAFDVDPEDYETEEEYLDVLHGKEREESGCFVSLEIDFEIPEETSDLSDRYYSRPDLPAEISKYYVDFDGLHFASAVADHFPLPEKSARMARDTETCLEDLISVIADDDVTFALKVWHWCLNTFLPYKESFSDIDGLQGSVVYPLFSEYEDNLSAAVEYMYVHRDFCEKVFVGSPYFPFYSANFVTEALNRGYGDLAEYIFRLMLAHNEATGEDVATQEHVIFYHCVRFGDEELKERFRKHIEPILNDRKKG